VKVELETMATLLVDSPPAPSDAQAQANSPNAAPGGPGAAPASAPGVISCKRCAAEMDAGQDWCLQCGAGAPGSIGTPRWRPAATVFVLVAALALGAAAAAVAALSERATKAPVVTTTVAAAPTTSTPTTTVPTAPGTTATTPGSKSSLPLGAVKPPKIPLTASTPKASETTLPATPSSGTTTSTPTTSTPTSTTPASGGKANEESQQSAILLDTNAASTYNPYGYPASEFSGPSLAIDDDPTTAWTAEVNPATAPKMAEGLLIDLKDQQRVAVLELITSTPGMTVQVYGAKGNPAPTSITDPAWKPLSAPKLIKKKHTRLALRDAKKQFTYITLWISRAPASAAGTAATPGHVDINEVELFPPKG
jgi:hypothetical protein